MKSEVEGIQYPCLGKDGDFEAGPAESQARLLAKGIEILGWAWTFACRESWEAAHKLSHTTPAGQYLCPHSGVYGTHPR